MIMKIHEDHLIKIWLLQIYISCGVPGNKSNLFSLGSVNDTVSINQDFTSHMLKRSYRFLGIPSLASYLTYPNVEPNPEAWDSMVMRHHNRKGKPPGQTSPWGTRRGMVIGTRSSSSSTAYLSLTFKGTLIYKFSMGKTIWVWYRLNIEWP